MHDSYIVYKSTSNAITYGCIQAIFHVPTQNLYLLKVQVLQEPRFDELFLGKQQFTNKHIIYGKFSMDKIEIVSVDRVIEKGCYNDHPEFCYFARFPNMCESS